MYVRRGPWPGVEAGGLTPKKHSSRQFHDHLLVYAPRLNPTARRLPDAVGLATVKSPATLATDASCRAAA